MEMEHINENLIKVLIESEDLEERGIDFLDLIGDQSRIEKFFYSILEEVDVDHHFHDTEAVTFQVIPNSNGLELYISRANLDEMDEIWDEELTRRFKEQRETLKDQLLNQQKARKNQKDSRPTKHPTQQFMNRLNERLFNKPQELGEEEETVEIIKFNQLDDFLNLAREIPSDLIEADLYHLDHAYYLVVYNIDQAVKTVYQADHLLMILEYGEVVNTTVGLLEEHGHLLRQEDALSFFGQTF